MPVFLYINISPHLQVSPPIPAAASAAAPGTAPGAAAGSDIHVLGPLATITRRCLDPTPAQRPTAAELVAELNKIRPA